MAKHTLSPMKPASKNFSVKTNHIFEYEPHCLSKNCNTFFLFFLTFFKNKLCSASLGNLLIFIAMYFAMY